MFRLVKHFYFIFVLSGCSTWVLEERCEKTNWFEYSQSLAFQGKYLEEDGFIKDCKGVERVSAQQLDVGFKLGREKMCQYDEIFQRGRKGIPVFFKFCDGLEMNTMLSQFSKGLKEFCTADNGYTYGKSGSVYQKVCDKDQEVQFLPRYKLGRKEYLISYVALLEAESLKMGDLLSSLSASERRLSNEYVNLPSPQECTSKSVYDEATKSTSTQTVCEESWYIKRQRNSLSSSLSEVRNQLDDVRRKIGNAASERLKAKKELESLI